MDAHILVLLIATTTIFLSSSSDAAAGTATFYKPPYVPSSCYGYTNYGAMVAAASPAIWDNRKACERRYQVVCTGATNRAPHPCKERTITVEIVDYCPKCGRTTIDLSEDAFSAIANPSAGRIKIDFY